ncbi:CHASE2 domain-containing protein [Coleofasciculus sp. LEGE 07092]|nr:CHASE2 domain-containing protein [Coleofasciculus sp. LEGE 07081]MBE9150912.1 CHASE2 domain-containing protein [Coleofasciculus sp. LEGE 07092]
MPTNRQLQRMKAKPSRCQTQHTKTQTKVGIKRWFNPLGWGHLLLGVWAVSGAIATALDGSLVQLMERQTQTFFFQLRGSVTPPSDIIILAIDDESIAQEQFYRAEPEKFPYLEPLATWPWKREAYAIAIDRLMQAGAKTVALDIIFDLPSNKSSDEQFRQILQKYAGRVTLAAQYTDGDMRQGSLTQLIQPNALFQTQPMSLGSINFPIEPNGRVHRLASEYPKLLSQSYPEQAQALQELATQVPSFDEATLQAAGVSYPQPKGNSIFFYGSPGTFETIPFWYVLDPENWSTYLDNGNYFKNKIVVIGGTASLFQDFHPTPFSESWLYPAWMSGVEIHANAIATLMTGRSIAEALPHPLQRGLLVFIGVIGTGVALNRLKQGWVRLGLTLGLVVIWGGISYVCFVGSFLILPTAVPILAIALSGFSYSTINLIRERLHQINLQRTLKRYSSAPLIREIISQHNDLRDLIREREQELLGQNLGGRYNILKVLGSGGFGDTYIAEDTQRPGNPHCVVKQLRPASDHPQIWKLATRLFVREAAILEELGRHDQIPQLLAYFTEDQDFYLVQELIVGHPLSRELPFTRPIPEVNVIAILRDLLPVLEFIHSQGVIHRDIKPENIIRRESDNQLVLIDFGAVKAIRTQLSEGEERTKLTIGIGTKGYMPREQAAGSPKFSSDIYALGKIAIQALTGLTPERLREQPETGETIWEEKATVSPEFAVIVNQMIRTDFRERYQSATEVLEALQPLIATLPPDLSPSFVMPEERATHSSSLSDIPDATVPWAGSVEPPEADDSTTMAWSESANPPEADDSTTMAWSESANPPEADDSTTMAWSDSFADSPKSPSSED